MTTAAVYAAVLPTFLVAHQVADHWVQTDTQAVTKDNPSWAGRWACLRHVATYTATLALTLAVVSWRLHLGLDPARVALVLGLNAATHYFADRRAPLVALATRLGKGNLARLGDKATAPTGTGAYSLDQSFHIGVLLITALFIT